MKPKTRRRVGFAAGASAAAAALLVLTSAAGAHLHAAGPMNTGHGALACASCHVAAPGTVRQQVQAAVGRWLGTRASDVDVGFRDVDNHACTSCHERVDDRHPVARFLEPRFAAQRATLAPHQCVSCHAEHRDARVTVADTGYCRNCHQDLALAHDPLDVSHASLVAGEQWETCLRCHDFHGNHEYNVPTRLADAPSAERVRAYFRGGESPYPGPVRVKARVPGSSLKDR
ncbi:MAG: cytochrome c3 family protein [Kofleriaceae bacterium]